MKVRQILFGGSTIHGFAANAGLLVLRAVTGLSLAFTHGLGKIPPSEQFIEGVTEMGFPAPGLFAWVAGLSEVAGGFLLALGLGTRPASLFILITMSTAFLIAHAGDPFGNKEKAVIYASIAFLYVLAGAGKYSVDALVSKRS